jgi:hypothetical protein
MGEGYPNLFPRLSLLLSCLYPNLLWGELSQPSAQTILRYPYLQRVRAIPAYAPDCPSYYPTLLPRLSPRFQPKGYPKLQEIPTCAPDYPSHYCPLSQPTVAEGYPNLRPRLSPTTIPTTGHHLPLISQPQGYPNLCAPYCSRHPNLRGVRAIPTHASDYPFYIPRYPNLGWMRAIPMPQTIPPTIPPPSQQPVSESYPNLSPRLSRAIPTCGE